MKSDYLQVVGTDAKDPYMGHEKDQTMFIRKSRRSRPFAIGFAMAALGYLLWSLAPVASWAHLCGNDSRASSWQPKVVDKPLVPLEAHIMSKCPDAKDCLKEMILPTMMRVYDKVNFTLSYIGTPTDNDGVDCMHGPQECMGNIIELCAAHLYPDPKSYLGFTMCLTRDYKDIPQRSLVEDCALEHGLDFGNLNECTVAESGGVAMGWLRDSVRRSTQAGVTISCTVRLNEEIYCIRDGGKWTDCPNGPGVNDLVIAIEKQYQQQSAPSTAGKFRSIAH